MVLAPHAWGMHGVFDIVAHAVLHVAVWRLLGHSPLLVALAAAGLAGWWVARRSAGSARFRNGRTAARVRGRRSGLPVRRQGETRGEA